MADRIPPVDMTTKLFPKAVMDALRAEFDGGSNLSGVSTRMATFGDSMTDKDQDGNKYAAWPELVSQYLGLELYNPSTAGERTSNISARQGGYAPRFTVPGGVLPATTDWFAVSLAESYTSGFNSGTTPNYVNIGNLGVFSFMGVPVNLRFLDSAWQMSRVTAGPQQVVPTTGGRALHIASRAWRNALQVYFGGYNGGDQVQDVTMMRDYLTDPDRFVVMSIAPGISGGGTSGSTAANNALRAAFPDQFFDLTAYVLKNGLQDEGIAPTAQDLADITAGTVPTSLRRASGDPHYNAAGNRVIARRLAEVLLERRLVPDGRAMIPARSTGTQATILSFPNSNARAQRESPTALQTASVVSARIINLKVDSFLVGQSFRTLIGRWGDDIGSASVNSWKFLLTGDGKLFMQDVNGPVGTNVVLTVPSSGLLSLRLDLNNTAGTVAFFTSPDGGASWTQVGSTTTGRGTTSMSSAAPLTVGPGPIGSVERVMVLDGSGTALLDRAFTDPNAADAAAWSYLNGAALVAK